MRIMEKKQQNLIERLEQQVTFGDLIEIVLNEGDFCAEHEGGDINIYQTTTDSEIPKQEFGIQYACGYYGGIRGTEEQFLCLNPTIHRVDAIARLHFQGDGLVKIPLSAIASYEILSAKRRGLRVVN